MVSSRVDGLILAITRETNDITLVGFSNAPHSTFVTPPLTPVVRPIHKIGQLVAQLLIRQLNNLSSLYPKFIY
ncbi:substrate-binding domain-containing protein [Spirosoma litoris]